MRRSDDSVVLNCVDLFWSPFLYALAYLVRICPGNIYNQSNRVRGKEVVGRKNRTVRAQMQMIRNWQRRVKSPGRAMQTTTLQMLQPQYFHLSEVKLSDSSKPLFRSANGEVGRGLFFRNQSNATYCRIGMMHYYNNLKALDSFPRGTSGTSLISEFVDKKARGGELRTAVQVGARKRAHRCKPSLSKYKHACCHVPTYWQEI